MKWIRKSFTNQRHRQFVNPQNYLMCTQSKNHRNPLPKRLVTITGRPDRDSMWSNKKKYTMSNSFFLCYRLSEVAKWEGTKRAGISSTIDGITQFRYVWKGNIWFADLKPSSVDMLEGVRRGRWRARGGARAAWLRHCSRSCCGLEEVSDELMTHFDLFVFVENVIYRFNYKKIK